MNQLVMSKGNTIKESFSASFFKIFSDNVQLVSLNSKCFYFKFNSDDSSHVKHNNSNLNEHLIKLQQNFIRHGVSNNKINERKRHIYYMYNSVSKSGRTKLDWVFFYSFCMSDKAKPYITKLSKSSLYGAAVHVHSFALVKRSLTSAAKLREKQLCKGVKIQVATVTNDLFNFAEKQIASSLVTLSEACKSYRFAAYATHPHKEKYANIVALSTIDKLIWQTKRKGFTIYSSNGREVGSHKKSFFIRLDSRDKSFNLLIKMIRNKKLNQIAKLRSTFLTLPEKTNFIYQTEKDVTKSITIDFFWKKKKEKKTYKLIRPLLSCSRAEITTLCNVWKLPVYPDQSNSITHYSRNRIRKQVLPAIRLFFNPKIENVLFQFTEIVSDQRFSQNKLVHQKQTT